VDQEMIVSRREGLDVTLPEPPPLNGLRVLLDGTEERRLGAPCVTSNARQFVGSGMRTKVRVSGRIALLPRALSV
jgi:hypothetical protein